DGGASQAAQPSKTSGVARVVVSGDSIVRSRPDTALITVAVVTQGQTALAAQQENARKSEAVVRAVKAAAGAGAEVETSGYSLQPQYTYRQNEQPLIQGYQARNGVNVTMSDLTKVGAVIDAATSAGANNVDNLSFTLRHDKPARDQALAEATRAALAKAQVIAQALGGRVTRILEVQEATDQPRPIPMYEAKGTAGRMMATDAQQTPVEIGTLDIRSQVQLVAEITTNQ
ncbi:MAG: SIMPL domain-containing protein, partial [Pyrinomonadaceae bacterium]